jgi:hypothetical protein
MKLTTIYCSLAISIFSCSKKEEKIGRYVPIGHDILDTETGTVYNHINGYTRKGVEVKKIDGTLVFIPYKQ